MIWIQVIIFVISNAPAMIKAIRELMRLWRGDPKVAKALLADLRHSKANPKVSMGDQLGDYQRIIDKYKEV